jgi:hypothetical protein
LGRRTLRQPRKNLVDDLGSRGIASEIKGPDAICSSTKGGVANGVSRVGDGGASSGSRMI